MIDVFAHNDNMLQKRGYRALLKLQRTFDGEVPQPSNLLHRVNLALNKVVRSECQPQPTTFKRRPTVYASLVNYMTPMWREHNPSQLKAVKYYSTLGMRAKTPKMYHNNETQTVTLQERS